VHMQALLSHTCTLCYHTKSPAFLYKASKRIVIPMQRDCLEITVKMYYNNIRLAVAAKAAFVGGVFTCMSL